MPVTPDTGRQVTILAFDFGQRRIGVAVGQGITGSASAVGTIANGERGPDWAALEALLADWRPDRLVVGLPLRVDGSESRLTRTVRDFCAALGRFGLPVETVDERYSSLEAEQRLKSARRDGRRGRVTREAVDATAAALIAERWLGDAAEVSSPTGAGRENS